MAKTPSSARKKTDAQNGQSAPRRLKQPKYSSFSLHRRIKGVKPTLPSGFRLFARTLKMFGRNWKLFLGMALVYVVLDIIFVQGFGHSGELTDAKSLMETVADGRIGTGITLFFYALGSASGVSGQASGVYQFFLSLMLSLAAIWALRQLTAGNKVRIRDSFYRGMYPMVPYILVMLVVLLQLLPFLIGIVVYNLVISTGIAVMSFEKILWTILLFATAVLSLYMICSSLFALYIVCLPDMTPVKALRSARQLVQFRRWSVLRKVVFLPIALIVVGVLIMLPILLFATVLAPWVLFILMALGLIVMHGYMYGLYRELLE